MVTMFSIVIHTDIYPDFLRWLCLTQHCHCHCQSSSLTECFEFQVWVWQLCQLILSNLLCCHLQCYDMQRRNREMSTLRYSFCLSCQFRQGRMVIRVIRLSLGAKSSFSKRRYSSVQTAPPPSEWVRVDIMVRVYTVFFVFKFANENPITNSFFVFKLANEKRIPFSFSNLRTFS